jgi:predicted nuclease of predicted toxin-antitoxin system
VAPRFKLDENLPREAEVFVREAGFDVENALSENLGGRPDSAIFDACLREDRILVTFDLGFSDTRAYPPAGCPGIWLLRPSRQSAPRTLRLLRRALKLVAAESPVHRLWVIDDVRVRIRE